MSKRRHYSENFNSEDYPADVLAFLAKNVTTPKTEMQAQYGMPVNPKKYRKFILNITILDYEHIFLNVIYSITTGLLYRNDTATNHFK